jgi:YXWGXW repeat-containing protein
MNQKKRWMILIVVVLALVMLNSLVFAVYSGANEYAAPYPPPPPPAIEAPTVAPAPGDAWIPGHWEWNGRQYVWAEGQWVGPPNTDSVWVPRHQEWNGHEWITVPGHWEQ